MYSILRPKNITLPGGGTLHQRPSTWLRRSIASYPVSAAADSRKPSHWLFTALLLLVRHTLGSSFQPVSNGLATALAE